MEKITKSFPGVVANEAVSITFLRGEIHALLGENGAGKSTLMNVLTGLYLPDSGRIEFYGKPVFLTSAADALAQGVGMVHQHFKLVQAFTVAQNLHMGWQETPYWISESRLNERTRAISAAFGLEIQPDARISDLSPGEQQRVEIVKVLARGARILILDEPTAVLTPEEAQNLFAALNTMKAAGKTIIFISHKLDEVLEISDRITTLRNGNVVATNDTRDMDSRKLANLMVGRDILSGRARRSASSRPDDTPVLTISNVSVTKANGLPALADVSLTIRPGEILGIAGVAGNGQRELSEVVTGMTPAAQGSISIAGRDISRLNPKEIADLGVGHIPEDRLKSGFAGAMPLTPNAALRHFRKRPVASGPWYREQAAAALAEEMIEAARVDAPGIHTPLRNLSGGNQQRLIVERECRIASKLLVAAYPMRGLDVGAIESLRGVIMGRSDDETAVLLISEELSELMEMSDRIAVLHRGEVVGVIDVQHTTREELGWMMGGQSSNEGIDGAG